MKKDPAGPAIAVLLLILAAAAFLRIYHNDLTPGWYNDEGTVINIANNINQGRLEYLGIGGSLLISARQPLFVYLLALIFRIFGSDILILRNTVAILGVLNTALIFFSLRKYGQWTAILCALAYALFPKAIFYARFGFSYNLVALFAILCFWSADHYLDTGKRRFIILSSLAIGLGVISEVAAVAFLPVMIVIACWKRWRNLFFALPLMLLPEVIYSLGMLLVSPQPYLYDLNFLLSRTSSEPLPVQLLRVLIDSGIIYQDLLFLAGVFGILIVPIPALKKRLALFLFIPFLIITRSNTIAQLGWYYLIPLFPFFAIGLGLLANHFLQATIHFSKYILATILSRFGRLGTQPLAVISRASWNMAFVILLMITPVIMSLIITIQRMEQGNDDSGLTTTSLDTAQARSTVEYINGHSTANDIILASPAIAWALKGNVTDYQISLAFQGGKTPHFPRDIHKDRFLFNPTYTHATYIVVDNIWNNWAENSMPELAAIREYAERSQPVFRTRDITVYRIKKP